MDFIIDTEGDQGLLDKDNLSVEYTDHSAEELTGLLKLISVKQNDLSEKEAQNDKQDKKLYPHYKFDIVINEFYKDMGWPAHVTINTKKIKKKKKKFQFRHLDLDTGKLKTDLAKVDVAAEMAKSVLKPGMEKEHFIPEYDKSEQRLKADRKKEREKTKGPGWFNMPATEVTDEIKNDLEVLKMRSALDPKHFYKKNDMEVLPKYFQVGRVMDSALDHKNERLTRKERKRTMVDELLANAEFSSYNKKKYKEIIQTKKNNMYRTHIRAKRTAGKIEKKNKKSNKKSSQSET